MLQLSRSPKASILCSLILELGVELISFPDAGNVEAVPPEVAECGAETCYVEKGVTSAENSGGGIASSFIIWGSEMRWAGLLVPEVDGCDVAMHAPGRTASDAEIQHQAPSEHLCQVQSQ